MNSVVVAFSGCIGSGKTSISSSFAARLGLPRVSFGDYMRYSVGEMGLDASDRSILQDIGALLAACPTSFCRSVLKFANYQSGQSLVVDGIRHIEILDELRVQVNPVGLLLVHVHTPQNELKHRLEKERQFEDLLRSVRNHKTEEQAFSILPDVADFVVTNDGSIAVTTIAEAVSKWVDEYTLSKGNR